MATKRKRNTRLGAVKHSKAKVRASARNIRNHARSIKSSVTIQRSVDGKFNAHVCVTGGSYAHGEKMRTVRAGRAAAQTCAGASASSPTKALGKALVTMGRRINKRK